MPWVKGQSGNPSGHKAKSAAERSLEELAREHTKKALRCLVDIMENQSEPAAARASAAAHIIDRGYGKPAQTVNANVRGQYWIADNPITADEWAFEFAPKPDETTVQ